MKVFNFNAGPAMLPQAVMEKAQKEFCDYKGSGCGIMEHSHRHKLFDEILERAISNMREIMGIPDTHAVVFIQGGASMQFAMIPMNLAIPGKPMEFADTGTWSSKAIKEAKLFGDVKVIASSKEEKYSSGNRSGSRLTACFSTRVSTPYKAAKSLSIITCLPRITYICCCTDNIWTDALVINTCFFFSILLAI